MASNCLGHCDGVLKSFKDLHESKENDWKKVYVGERGRIYFYESLRIQPGATYIYFFPDVPKKDVGVKDVLMISVGNMELEKDTVRLTTKNSIYEFELEENESEDK